MKNWKIVLIVLVILVSLFVSGCGTSASESVTNKPMLVTITQYDNGQKIGSWHGEYTIEIVGGAIVAIDEHGKMMILTGSIQVQEVSQ